MAASTQCCQVGLVVITAANAGHKVMMVEVLGAVVATRDTKLQLHVLCRRRQSRPLPWPSCTPNLDQTQVTPPQWRDTPTLEGEGHGHQVSADHEQPYNPGMY